MNEQQIIDVAEEVAPEVVKTVNAVRDPRVVIAATAVVSLAAGVFVGYKAAIKKLEPKYAALADAEIQEAREHYQKIHKKDAYPTVADAVADLIPPTEVAANNALEAYSGMHKVVARTVEITENEHGIHVKSTDVRDDETFEEPDSKVQHRNIFLDGQPLNDDEWDYEVEEGQRTEDDPYIIHEDEFNENEPDFEDVALTYYAGDDVLTNEQDEVVEDVDDLVGERNLRHFGHGASDKDMLFIRNHKRGLNIEISRSMGKYAKEVLGFEEEDDASPQPKPRRKKRGDSEE